MYNEENAVSDAYEQEILEKEPRANVLSKEDFEKRAEKVFKTIWKILSKSFGPGGAPTIISNYPYIHTTKDGFTIAKNISMDATTSVLDQAIANMAFDICGRLNYSVGDGTTTAIIATYQLYNSYLKEKDKLKELSPMSYMIMDSLKEIKDRITKVLSSDVRAIMTKNPKLLRDKIHDVVYISSNGNSEITDMIADLYEKLMYPAINCVIAPDGITKTKIIDGFRINITLTDRLYINQDDNRAVQKDCDVIVFSTKVNTSIYKDILVPLNNACRMRHRHLIVVAPSYDTVTIGQLIQRDLTNEYKVRKDVNMILTTCKSNTGHDRKRLEDFAMLCNTIVIDRVLLESIAGSIMENHTYYEDYFALDNRDIPGTLISCNGNLVYYDTKNENQVPDTNYAKDAIRVGHVDSANLGLDMSTFAGFNYNENIYQATVKEAEDQLKEDEEKYQKLGTFNVVVNHDQERLYSLGLKMGIIEVGGDSEMTQKFLKDAVDDSVKAAASAYKHGVVLGCNTSLIRAIYEFKKSIEPNEETKNDDKNTLKYILTDMLLKGYVSVYKTMLENVFEDVVIHSFTGNKADDEYVANNMKDIIISVQAYSNNTFGQDVFGYGLQGDLNWLLDNQYDITIHNVIIAHSVVNDKVFDVRALDFTRDVVNSVETDRQVLTATTDLISILISGNQMVLTGKHNF